MKNKLFNKIYFSTVVLFIISIFVLMVSLSVVISNYFTKEKKALLVDNCLRISMIANNERVAELPFENEEMTVNMFSGLAHSIDAEIYILDEDGITRHCSCAEWIDTKNCMHSAGVMTPEILEKVQSSDDAFFDISSLDGKYPDLYYTAATVMKDGSGQIRGYVFASSSAAGLEEMLNSLSTLFLITAAFPIILLAASVYVTTQRITKPLKLMSEAAHSMAVGDFSKRIPVTSDDEIAELARSFNLMTNSFVQLETMQRSFITNVSHELRTPITTIAGFIDGILDGTIPKDQQSHYLQIVSSEAKRLTKVVQSMLSLAKLESGEMKVNLQKCDMTEIIANCLISQEKRIVDNNIEIAGLEDCDRFEVSVDKDLFSQVIYNLVDNAIKFTPKDSKIEFRLFYDENAKAHVIIKNYGLGIEKEEMKHVFEKFYKNDKVRSQNREGVGIGLYIVKTIMDIHNGTVSVSSEDGKYTEFELILPNNK